MLSEAFGKLSKFPLLFIIPIVVDGLSVLLGTAMNGFHGSSHFTFKLALQMGLPSISAVTEQTFMPGAVQISGGFNATSMLGVLFFLLLFLVVQSFLQGGYVGLLYEAVTGGRLSLERFAAYGTRCFGRFFLLNILVLVFLFVLGGIVTFVFKMAGVVLFMVVFLLLRVLFLFLEYTIVVDDCSIPGAFSRSREAFRHRTSDTLPLVIIALVVNVVAGIVVNALWFSFFFLVLLVLYDLVGAGLQLAFMRDYLRIRR